MCCFCQLCCYGCMNPIEKDKCYKKGACKYTIDYLRDEACPRNTRPDIEVCTCFKGYYRAISFHMGSILIGAFLIAIIQVRELGFLFLSPSYRNSCSSSSLPSRSFFCSCFRLLLRLTTLPSFRRSSHSYPLSLHSLLYDDSYYRRSVSCSFTLRSR